LRLSEVNVFHHIEELSRLPGPVHLAIGVFDGVHLGHQAVIQRALSAHGTGVAVTFDPHPARVLRHEAQPLLLTSTRHKISILKRLGVSHLLVLRFDENFSRTTAEDFVRRLQTACRPLGSVAVGRDWTFGHRGAGNVDLLRRLGVEVHAVDPVVIDGEVASSTLVREAIVRGDFVRAAEFLGRSYTVLGRVVAGQSLGRQLGFPTANLAVESEQLPPSGVYAVRAELGGESLAGVANLGRRPTLNHDTDTRQLEVHLFDFTRDIYGRDLEIEFVRFLRAEQKFRDIDGLQAQIAQDAAVARDILIAERPVTTKRSGK
jgi:riboflavin kinase / FMN adenylyltransferase